MATLIIQDLLVTSDLDAASMLTVRGGMYKGGYFASPVYKGAQHEFSFNAEQLTSQTQDNFNATGNNAAFVSGIHSTFKPNQSNQSSISF